MLLLYCSFENSEYSDTITAVLDNHYLSYSFIQEFDSDITKKLKDIKNKGYAIYKSYDEFKNDLSLSPGDNIDESDIKISEDNFKYSIVIGFLVVLTGGDSLKNYYVDTEDNKVSLKYTAFNGKNSLLSLYTYAIFYQISK